jgi:hypothetical protein
VVFSVWNFEVNDLAAAEINFDTACHWDSLILCTSVAA